VEKAGGKAGETWEEVFFVEKMELGLPDSLSKKGVGFSG